jgi:beta-lactamase regulating signal transducer with metallopeptidase domain
MSSLSTVEALARIGTDATIKATVLLVVALLATKLLRNSSAAIRHHIWSLTMVGLLLLPILSALLPPWQIPILSGNANVTSAQSRAMRESVTDDPSSSTDASMTHGSVALTDSLKTSPDMSQTGEASLVPVGQSTSIKPLSASPFAWLSRLALVTWSLGVVVSACGVVAGLRHARQLSLRSQVLGDERLQELLNTLMRRLRLHRAVELREYDQPIVPLTWGIFRAKVLLPRQARTWPESMRRTVLLHELAHVKRGDVVYQFLGRIACSIYWFHPLAWFALRRSRLEREHACDDAVVHSGEKASDYAQQLVEVARLYHRPEGLMLAVAMTRGDLEQRLQGLFNTVRSHRPLGRISTMVVSLLTGLFLCAAAVLQPVALETLAAADEPKDAVPQVSKTLPPAIAKKEGINDAKPQGRVQVRIVIAKHVKLWEGKEIVTWKQIEEKMATDPNPSRIYPQILFTRAGSADGRDLTSQIELGQLSKRFQFEGHSVGWLSPRCDPRFDNIKTAEDLKVDEANRIDGRVLDQDGNPVADAEVLLIPQVDKTLSYTDYDFTITEGRVNQHLEHVMTLTDHDGKFALYPAAKENFSLIALHPVAGFGYQRKEQFAQKPELRLAAWSGLECELKQDKPNQDEKVLQLVTLRTRIQNTDGLPDIYLNVYPGEAGTKKGNQFHFHHVPSFYSTAISRGIFANQGVTYHLPAATIELLPGETQQMSFGPLTPQQRARLESNRRMLEAPPKPVKKAVQD